MTTFNNNSPFQDYVHQDDQTQSTFEMTPGFKPFTKVSDNFAKKKAMYNTTMQLIER